MGVAAATAFLNQKLLAALFGEAAMAELIAGARTRLQDALTRRSTRSVLASIGSCQRPGHYLNWRVDLRNAAAAVRALQTDGG